MAVQVMTDQNLCGICPSADQDIDQPDNSALVREARDGKQAAFRTLLQKYQVRVYSLACRFVSNADAADITQQAFILVFNRLETLRDGAKFGSWLKRIAVNLSINLNRHQQARATSPLDEHAAAMIANEAAPR